MSIFEVLRQDGSDEEKAAEVAELLATEPDAVSQKDEQMSASPLHWAVHLRLPKVAAVLLEKGANINAIVEEEKETPLHIAAMYDESATIIPWLLEHGADIEARTDQDATALHIAASYGRIKAVQLLLEGDADVEAKQKENDFTPLACAAWSGHTECVKALLEHGANIEARDDGGNTPLGSAAFQDQLEVVQLLLKHGADVNARNNAMFGGDDLPGLRIIDLAEKSWQGSRVAKFLSAQPA